MKKAIFIIMLFIAATAQSVPAFPGLIKFTQPADRSIVSIYLKGDERVHWAESEDGYSLLHRDDGSFVFAMLNAEGDMVPSPYLAADKEMRSPETEAFLLHTPRHLHYSQSQVESLTRIWREIENAKQGPKAMSEVTGNKKFLLILFEFNDCHFTHSANEFNNLMNQVNYSVNNRTGSVRDYYYDVSGGLFTLSMDVVGPFTGVESTAFYGNSNYGSQYFAREAVDSAAKYVNFADYDNDGDGYIDGFHIIFAGHGEEAGASADHIWSHKSYIMDPPTYNNTVVDLYSCSPECSGSNDTILTHIGVICHELGHVFGAPDFYDTDYSGSGGEFPGLGDWDIMSSGSWNGGGKTPAHHNPFTKIYIYKWATCDTLTNTPAQYVMDPVAVSNSDFFRVNTSTPKDFFLIENRQKIKWDGLIPGHGMVVYHAHPNIDGTRVRNSTHPQQLYILASSYYQYPNSTPSSYGVVNSSYATYPGEGNRRDSLTDNSTPWFRPWSQQPNNLPIFNIADDPVTGKLYFSVQDISPTPLSAMAEGIDTDKVQLTWERYGTMRTLILRGNDPNQFGTPSGDIHLGDTLEDGSIVVYFNNGYSTVVSNLEEGNNYFFKLFTRKNNGTFSDGIVIEGSTLTCPHEEWHSEDFENTPANALPDCWTGNWHVENLGTQKVLVSNLTSNSERSYVATRPFMFETMASRVLSYKAHFFEGCDETTLLEVEVQPYMSSDWTVIDQIAWQDGIDEWTEHYLILDNIGDYCRLRFSVPANASGRIAIDDLQLSNSWLIQSSAEAGGTIEPLGYSAIPWGDTIEFIVRPDPGFEIHRMTYDKRVILSSRLTALDDGSYSYKVAEITGLHKINATFKRNTGIANIAEQSVSVHPNPTNDMLTVECTAGSKLKLYDTRGSLLMNLDAASESTTLDLHSLAKGIYILHCIGTNNEMRSIKVVKQ